MADKPQQSTGRRKEAVARVRLMEGNSQISVNSKPISEIFKGPLMQRRYQKPFEVTKTLGKYTATVRVEGGGQASQLTAITLGIARLLVEKSDEYKTQLRAAGLLTRDPRVKERRKYGHAHKARAMKSSPKR